MKPQEQQQDSLQNQFSNLEMEWDSIKQSFSSSTRSDPTAFDDANHRLFRLYDSSPKELMSLLQQENSPHDRAAIDAIEDREAGKRVVGRRLFEEYEVENSDSDDGDGESEASTVFSWVGSEKRGEIYGSENGGVFIECFYMDVKSDASDGKYGENCNRVCVCSDENDGFIDECDKKSEVSTEFSCIGSLKNGKISEKISTDSDGIFGVFNDMDGISYEFGENCDKFCDDSDQNGEVFDNMDIKSKVDTQFIYTGWRKYGENSAKVCKDLLKSSTDAVMASLIGGGVAGKRMICGVAMLFAIGIAAFMGQDEQILVPT